MPAAFFAQLTKIPGIGAAGKGTVPPKQSRNDTTFTFAAINVFIRFPFCQTMCTLS